MSQVDHVDLIKQWKIWAGYFVKYEEGSPLCSPCFLAEHKLMTIPPHFPLVAQDKGRFNNENVPTEVTGLESVRDKQFPLQVLSPTIAFQFHRGVIVDPLQ